MIRTNTIGSAISILVVLQFFMLCLCRILMFLPLCSVFGINSVIVAIISSIRIFKRKSDDIVYV